MAAWDDPKGVGRAEDGTWLRVQVKQGENYTQWKSLHILGVWGC